MLLGRRVRGLDYLAAIGVLIDEVRTFDSKKSNAALLSGVFLKDECVCSALSLGCGEALVSCVVEHCARVFV